MKHTHLSIVVVTTLFAGLAHAQVANTRDAGPRPIEPREAEPADAGVVDAGLSEAELAAQKAAAPFALQARIEPPLVEFGARFDLVIELSRDRGLRLDVPELPESKTAPRVGDAVRSVEELPALPAPPDAGPIVAHPRVKETIRIPFLALDVDDVKTPAFVLKSAEGTTLDVPALPVRVHDGTPPPPNDPKTGQPPQGLVLEGAASNIQYTVPDTRPWVLLSTTAVAGLLYAFVRWRLGKRSLALPTVVEPPKKARPAHERALEHLDALLAAGLLARGETAVFVERLMDEVLREYVQGRFGLPAGSRTTRELVAELLGISVPGLDVKLVETLLADADLVKFARAAIAPDQAHGMATRVRALIEATALRVVVQEAA
jgi:hypothetical protein